MERQHKQPKPSKLKVVKFIGHRIRKDRRPKMKTVDSETPSIFFASTSLPAGYQEHLVVVPGLSDGITQRNHADPQLRNPHPPRRRPCRHRHTGTSETNVSNRQCPQSKTCFQPIQTTYQRISTQSTHSTQRGSLCFTKRDQKELPQTGFEIPPRQESIHGRLVQSHSDRIRSNQRSTHAVKSTSVQAQCQLQLQTVLPTSPTTKTVPPTPQSCCCTTTTLQTFQTRRPSITSFSSSRQTSFPSPPSPCWTQQQQRK